MLVTETKQDLDLYPQSLRDLEMCLSLKRASCLRRDAGVCKVDCSFGQRLNFLLTPRFILKIVHSNGHVVIMGCAPIGNRGICLLKYSSASHVREGLVSGTMPGTVIFIALLSWHFKLPPLSDYTLHRHL